MFGSSEVATALVFVALALAFLLALLSYHPQSRNYVNWGVGLLVVVTVLALLIQSFKRPGWGSSVVLLMIAVGVMLILLTYQGRVFAHAAFWLGVFLFLLALPFVGAGRGDLALLSIIGGPGLLMLIALMHPDVPATYSRIGATDATNPPTAAELSLEKSRYTKLAAGVTIASIFAVMIARGIPEAPVEAAFIPEPVNEQEAAKGAQLTQQFGCVTCHNFTTPDPKVGPSLKGLYGRHERMSDGTVVVADAAYIRESILQPNAKIVNGYNAGTMLAGIGSELPTISQPANLNALVEYIKSLK